MTRLYAEHRLEVRIPCRRGPRIPTSRAVRLVQRVCGTQRTSPQESVIVWQTANVGLRAYIALQYTQSIRLSLLTTAEPAPVQRVVNGIGCNLDVIMGKLNGCNWVYSWVS